MARNEGACWTSSAGGALPFIGTGSLPSSNDMARAASLLYKYDYNHARSLLEADIRAVKENAFDEHCQQAVECIKAEIRRLAPPDCDDKYHIDDNVTDARASPTFWFYQPVGHGYSYLSSLDIRMLVHEYGHYSSFPHLVCPSVERETHVVLDKQLRTKYRYLSHLPLGTLRFLDCDWSGILSSDTLALFADEADARRNPLQSIPDDAADTSADTSGFTTSSISTPVSPFLEQPCDVFIDDYDCMDDDTDYVYNGARTNWEDEIQIVVKQTGKRRRNGRTIII
jgi:hypothetical protein